MWPPDINLRSAREEAEMVIFESVAEVLKKTKLRPSQVAACGTARPCGAAQCCTPS